MSILGIDPGRSGAWALISISGEYMASGLCPDSPQGMVMDLLPYSKTIQMCSLELVHAFPGQGVTSMFSFGTNFGMWQGILASFGIPYHFVTPQKWMAEVLDSHKKGEKVHLQFARRRWVDAPWHRKKDEGVAAALCIAEYARLTAK